MISNEFLLELKDTVIESRNNAGIYNEIITPHKRDFTMSITENVVHFLNSHHYNIIREYRIPDYTRPNSDKGGIVDLIAESNTHKLAIEIDSSIKKISLYKLLHLKEKGYIPIWILWRKYQFGRNRDRNTLKFESYECEDVFLIKHIYRSPLEDG